MAVPAVAQDKLRIVTVNMNKLVSSYYRTVQVEDQIKGEQDRLKEDNNERLARIRMLQDQLEVFNKRIADPATSDQKRKQLAEERKVTHNETVALERERKEFIARRKQALNEKFAQHMQGIYNDIGALIEEQSKLGNYDYVLNKSAQGRLGGPALLYAKDASDITADLIKLINKDAPEGFQSEDKPSE